MARSASDTSCASWSGSPRIPKSRKAMLTSFRSRRQLMQDATPVRKRPMRKILHKARRRDYRQILMDESETMCRR